MKQQTIYQGEIYNVSTRFNDSVLLTRVRGRYYGVISYSDRWIKITDLGPVI